MNPVTSTPIQASSRRGSNFGCGDICLAQTDQGIEKVIVISGVAGADDGTFLVKVVGGDREYVVPSDGLMPCPDATGGLHPVRRLSVTAGAAGDYSFRTLDVSRVDDLQQQLEVTLERLKQARAQTNKDWDMIMSLREKILDCDAAREDLKLQNNALKSGNVKLMEEKEELKSLLKKVEESYRASLGKVKVLEDQKTAMRVDLERAGNEIRALRGQNENLSKENILLKGAHGEMLMQLNAYKFRYGPLNLS